MYEIKDKKLKFMINIYNAVLLKIFTSLLVINTNPKFWIFHILCFIFYNVIQRDSFVLTSFMDFPESFSKEIFSVTKLIGHPEEKFIFNRNQ